MSKDYKARPTPARARRRGGSGFFWFVTGAVVGGFGVGLAWMLDEREGAVGAPVAQAEGPAVPTKPSFQFYDILPELEVVVPSDELAPLPKTQTGSQQPPPIPAIKPPEAQAAVKPTPEDAPSGSYLLQVASFRTSADAERLKAQLALKGIKVQVQQVTINGKDTYHRVRAGPFQGKQAVNQARSQLASSGFEPIAIKVK